jgi:hypothetical protein
MGLTMLSSRERLREEFRALTGHYSENIWEDDDWDENDLEDYYNNMYVIKPMRM